MEAPRPQLRSGAKITTFLLSVWLVLFDTAFEGGREAHFLCVMMWKAYIPTMATCLLRSRRSCLCTVGGERSLPRLELRSLERTPLSGTNGSATPPSAAAPRATVLASFPGTDSRTVEQAILYAGLTSRRPSAHLSSRRASHFAAAAQSIAGRSARHPLMQPARQHQLARRLRATARRKCVAPPLSLRRFAGEASQRRSSDGPPRSSLPPAQSARAWKRERKVSFVADRAGAVRACGNLIAPTRALPSPLEHSCLRSGSGGPAIGLRRTFYALLSPQTRLFSRRGSGLRRKQRVAPPV